ncbi:ribose-phosphate pyrophosphokinase [Desulfobacca acetoxidans]|uniref:Ribose-phosphate pyrophosphokinase n=1 Tax=Desulfobacca acetoxidans (strain ATCC 700848 / DSM 11109 / ASRB2) TaxID=880072 RepID=F2NJP2_DESAR|nr:ribose-phosphate pyrophosphokinase [Desulfobacca acetoxidans]AEB09697.1 ribose-phosphate pyrophosphokinase [Desulfobacca acetoxidans DSM 11109]
MNDTLKIFAGNSNPDLALEICNCLSMPLGKAFVGTFSDGEIRVEVGENVRGKDVFVIQSTCHPVNNNIMELLIIIDALKRASARRITAVIPYYGYARQDRKVAPRVPISAKLVADLLTSAGANRILTMDLHVGQIQGFFNIPVDNLYASSVMMPYIKANFRDDPVMVSPDAGGVPRARAYAKRLEANLAFIDKRRDAPGKAKAMHIIGEVKDRVAVILDDIIDTGGTLSEAAKVLLEKGASAVYACCSHPVLSGPAVERIQESPLKGLVVTDTIPLRENALQCKKIHQLSVAPLFCKAITGIHKEDSISSLFDIQF